MELKTFPNAHFIENVIIGGGLAGLITAFYNKGYTIITKQFGGEAVHSFPLGPRIFKKTKETKQLLEDLYAKGEVIKHLVKKRIYKIGYMVEDKIVPYIPWDYKQMYYTKTRGLISRPPKSIMSDGDTEIKAYNIPMDHLLGALRRNIESIMYGEVHKIDINKKTLYLLDGTKVLYKKLISTIPLVYLVKSVQKPDSDHLLYSSTLYILCKNTELDLKDFDYVYYPEAKYPYHRITKIGPDLANGRTLYVMETNASETENIFKALPKEFDILDDYRKEVGQILNSKDIPLKEYQGIKLIGRYAQWSHSIRISEVIKRAKEVRRWKDGN